jgi:C4-dicarboxylate transporter, DctM subunit
MLTPVALVIFGLTLLFGLPIAFSLYYTSFVMLLHMKIPPMIMVQRVIGGIYQYPLLCVPFFILAGSLMSSGGITHRLIHFANLLVGRFRGALSLVNVLACMFFGGISGSGVADATAIGSILIPSMKKEGYKSEYAAALTASAAVCGPIIPPSIPMVVLGIVCSIPIGRLFLAGALPGLLLGMTLMAGAYIHAVRKNHPRHEAAPMKAVLKGFKESASALAMPFIIVGGIASGAVTDAELGVLAALYALFVGVFIHRELDIRKIYESLKETVVTTGVVLFILGAASLFSWLLTVSGVPQLIVKGIFALTDSKILIILMINLLLLFVGCIMDGIAAILLLAPVLLPLASQIGMDPLHFSVMMVFNLMLGLLTPPVGLTTVVTMRIADAPLGAVVKELIPYFLLCLAVLAIITIFPWFSLFLPKLFF